MMIKIRHQRNTLNKFQISYKLIDYCAYIYRKQGYSTITNPNTNTSKSIDGYNRYKVYIAYKGTKYCGIANPYTNDQSNNKEIKKPSIISIIDKALSDYTCNQHMNLKLSSRTDAGVHALRNVIQVDLPKKTYSNRVKYNHLELEPYTIMNSINHHIRALDCNDIHIVNMEKMHETFNARKEALARTYQYHILCPRHSFDQKNKLKNTNLFHQNQTYIHKYYIDITKMQDLSELLLGELDYSSFRGQQCQSIHAIRNIQQINISKHDNDPNHLLIDVS